MTEVSFQSRTETKAGNTFLKTYSALQAQIQITNILDAFFNEKVFVISVKIQLPLIVWPFYLQSQNLILSFDFITFK